MSNGELLIQTASGEALQVLNLMEIAFEAPNIGTFAEVVVPKVARVLPATAVFLFLSDSRLPATHFVPYGFEPHVASEIESWCVNEFERISCSPDIQRLPGPVLPAGWVLGDLTLIPLRYNGKPVGLMGFVSGEGIAQVSPDGFAGILAKGVGRLLERAGFEKQISYLNTYLTISSMLAQSLDLHDLLESALNCCMEAVSADAASVLVLDDEKKNFNFYQAEGPSKPLLMAATFPADKGIAGSVLQTGQPELINDVHNDPRFFKDFDVKSGFETKNMIAIPLLAGEEQVGVLEVLNKAGGGRFTKEELLVLVSVAEEIAFAIRNAKVFEYVVNTYCLQRQGRMSCKGCRRPLGSWTPCVKYREGRM